MADDNNRRGKRAGTDVKSRSSASLRLRLSQAVWLVCVVAALFLAVGALCIALDANRDNALVSFILETAGRLDLGVFSRNDGIKQFTGDNAATKNALFNWGLAAIVWLVVGRILERIIRP